MENFNVSVETERVVEFIRNNYDISKLSSLLEQCKGDQEKLNSIASQIFEEYSQHKKYQTGQLHSLLNEMFLSLFADDLAKLEEALETSEHYVRLVNVPKK